MNIKNTITILLITVFLFSCKNSNQSPQEKQSRKQLKKIIKNLPNLKTEIDEIEKKLDAKQITGSIEMIVDGKNKKFTAFSGNKSSVIFRKEGVADYMIYTDKTRKERFQIILTADDLFQLKDHKFYASNKPDMSNMELLKKMVKKNINVEYLNKNTNERYASNKGTITLTKLTDNELKFSYSNEGFLGDYRKKKFIPVTFNIHIKNNFITADFRNK